MLTSIAYRAMTKRDDTRALIFNLYDDPYKRLAACIVLQAVKDAKSGNQDALEWLEGPAIDLLEMMGMGIWTDNFASRIIALRGRDHV